MARSAGQAFELGGDAEQGHVIGLADDRYHQPALGLHRDAEMHRLEGDDLVGIRIEMRVESREARQRSHAQAEQQCKRRQVDIAVCCVQLGA